MEKIEKLAEIINSSNYIVAFTGAGTSTDSGLKDFRSKDGLYSRTFMGYEPEEILSHDFFFAHGDIFDKYLDEKLNINGIQPNAGHKALAKLEEMGKVKSVITQNIDDLHQMAGSKNVLELHGTLKKWYCLKCGKKDVKRFKCSCGGTVRPQVTLYGEMLNEDVTREAINEIANADTLIIIGTSLTVYPAAYYITYFKGKNLVIINNDATQYDSKASLVINDNFASTMKKVLPLIK